MSTATAERTCDHRSLEGCYITERSLYPRDVLHCNCCDHRVRFDKNSHPETANPTYEQPCPSCANNPGCGPPMLAQSCVLHWMWACNAEIVFDEHQPGASLPIGEAHEHGIVLL